MSGVEALAVAYRRREGEGRTAYTPVRAFRLFTLEKASVRERNASHTVWKSRDTFEAWTRSEAFRAAHHKAGDHKPLYLGHPLFEGFETIQTV